MDERNINPQFNLDPEIAKGRFATTVNIQAGEAATILTFYLQDPQSPALFHGLARITIPFDLSKDLGNILSKAATNRTIQVQASLSSRPLPSEVDHEEPPKPQSDKSSE